MDMDFLREVAPFVVGIVAVPPLALLATRQNWSDIAKFAGVFVVALILGAGTSYMAGELAVGMPNALLAVIIDTSLVYTGSQLAWKLVWKPVLLLTRRDKPSTVSRRQK